QRDEDGRPLLVGHEPAAEHADVHPLARPRARLGIARERGAAVERLDHRRIGLEHPDPGLAGLDAALLALALGLAGEADPREAGERLAGGLERAGLGAPELRPRLLPEERDR